MSKKNPRLASLITLAAALLMLVAGCIPSFPPGINPLSPVGTLNLFDAGPITLDPAISGDASSHQYILQIFSGLMRLDDNLKPVPDVASSFKRSEDGKTYTFSLHRDVKFHNGREVKAQDFKYSWERAAAPATGSQTASVFLADILGARDVIEGKTTEMRGVKVVDDYTLEVTIDAPKAYFLSKMTYPTSFVVDKANVESGKEWWRKPNGTGPFKLKEWQVDNLLVLEANQQFYGGAPKLKEINFGILSGRPVSLYQTEKIDVASVFQDYVDQVRDKTSALSKEIVIEPELSFTYIGFNVTKPPFDDPDVRRAFSHVVDKQKIIKVTQKDMVTKADGILPKGMPGFNPNLKGLDYNVAEAKRLLARSKYGDASKLPPITITISGWGGNLPDNLSAMIHDWRQNLGVNVKVRQLEPENFLYFLRQEKDEMFLLGWVADYPDPQNFLENLFRTGLENNYSEYSNRDLDSLLDRAAVEADEATRLGLYRQAEEILVNDAACLPLWFGSNYVLVKPYVKNYKVNPQGSVNYREVYIER